MVEERSVVVNDAISVFAPPRILRRNRKIFFADPLFGVLRPFFVYFGSDRGRFRLLVCIAFAGAQKRAAANIPN